MLLWIKIVYTIWKHYAWNSFYYIYKNMPHFHIYMHKFLKQMRIFYTQHYFEYHNLLWFIVTYYSQRILLVVYIHYFFKVRSVHIRNSFLSRFSRARKWVPLTINEMKGFLAVIVNMGIVRKPTIPEHLKKSHDSQLSRWFMKMFSRNRFQLILKFFHLVDNKKIPNRNSPNNRWIDPLALPIYV